MARLVVGVPLILLLVSVVFAQNPPKSDPQAVSFASQSIAALTGGKAIHCLGFARSQPKDFDLPLGDFPRWDSSPKQTTVVCQRSCVRARAYPRFARR